MSKKELLGMSLEISQDFIDNVAKDLLTESLIKTLDGSNKMVQQIISDILSVKVDKTGRVSSYSYDNKQTYLQYLVNDMIKNEVKEVAEEVLKERRAEIRKVIRDTMSKKATLDKFYDAFFSSVVENLNSTWATTINVNIDKKENY